MTYPYQLIFECGICWCQYNTVEVALFCEESHHD